jgi:hypothetical protein
MELTLAISALLVALAAAGLVGWDRSRLADRSAALERALQIHAGRLDGLYGEITNLKARENDHLRGIDELKKALVEQIAKPPPVAASAAPVVASPPPKEGLSGLKPPSSGRGFSGA